LTERYDERIAGVLCCFDRVVVTGTLPGVCYAEGMTRFLYANKIRIFDYLRLEAYSCQHPAPAPQNACLKRMLVERAAPCKHSLVPLARISPNAETVGTPAVHCPIQIRQNDIL
jgi:hypothetical protein